MYTADAQDHKVNTVLSYFRKVDSGDGSYLELFDDNIDFFFPKFGTAIGKDALIRFGERIGSSLSSIWHDIDNFNIIVSGQTLVVEGQEGGTMADGTIWPDNKVSQGRFCSVFEFKDELISRMYIYVDPDFPSVDSTRIAVLQGNMTE